MILVDAGAVVALALWEMLERGAVRLLSLDRTDFPRMREFMRKYADRPMDMADAALLRVAEREGIRKIHGRKEGFRGLSAPRPGTTHHHSVSGRSVTSLDGPAH